MNSQQKTVAGQKPPPRSTSARILYVDDEEALVQLARRVIIRLGYKAVVHTDPTQALAAFREHPQDFDLVITDLSMPQMSGFDLVRELRAIRPDLPVALTSGFIQQEDEERARELGVRELITKPATVDSLAATFERLFGPKPLKTG